MKSLILPLELASSISHNLSQTCLPVDNSPEDRTPYALAMVWISRITAIVIEMVLPGVIGYWIDQRLGTKVVFFIIGVFLGFAGGIWQLIKLKR